MRAKARKSRTQVLSVPIAYSLSYATDADEPSAVGRVSQVYDLDSGAGVWRVNHPAVTDVDADVPESRKEEQVAWLHLGTCYRPAKFVECVGAVWKLDAKPPVRPVDEPRAVEAGGG